jgi:hypothetical protein
MKAKAKMKGPLEFEFDSLSLTQEEAVDWLKKAINMAYLMNPNSKIAIKVELKELVV